MAKKRKQVRLWLYQNSLSGNANGHFALLELPVESKKEDVKASTLKWCHACFNIKDLGVHTSMIGDTDFPCESLLKRYCNFKQTKQTKR